MRTFTVAALLLASLFLSTGPAWSLRRPPCTQEYYNQQGPNYNCNYAVQHCQYGNGPICTSIITNCTYREEDGSLVQYSDYYDSCSGQN